MMNFARSRAVQSATARDNCPQGTPGAVIVGGAHVSIGLARSLGRHGIPVWHFANHPLPKFSRYIRRSMPWPGADQPDGVDSIIDAASRYGLIGWVLFATGDEDMGMIARNHALFASRFRVVTANWDTTRWMYDKRLTYQRATELGIDCPVTFQPSDRGEVERLDCRFPVILKPAFRTGLNEFTRAKAWKADDRDALLSLYERAAAVVGNDAVIIQELVPGGGEAQFSYAGLWNDGQPIASLVARRTRQYPIDFGRSSTFVEIVERDQVEKSACRFLQSFDYTGVVEIEFKYDRRDRRYKLLDANGRFWTWNSLGRIAGIDFPYLAWRQALVREVPCGRARTDVAWMHLSRDIIAAYREISRGGLTLSEYLAGFRRQLTFADFALDDPLPAIVELPVLAWNRIVDRRGKHSGKQHPKQYGDSLPVGR